jgi:hypothetical protein
MEVQRERRIEEWKYNNGAVSLGFRQKKPFTTLISVEGRKAISIFKKLLSGNPK